jgi:hypothetical protein
MVRSERQPLLQAHSSESVPTRSSVGVFMGSRRRVEHEGRETSLHARERAFREPGARSTRRNRFLEVTHS